MKRKKGPKTFVALLLVGANIASVLVMLLCGFSMRINPVASELFVPFELTFPVYVIVNLVFLLIWAAFSPKYIWVSIAGLVLCFSAVRAYCPINLPNPHPQGCIKVMSYNVKGFSAFEAEKNNRFKNVLEYLSHSDADIICFQEFMYAGNDNGKKIYKTLKRWAYRDSMAYGKENSEGICSRYPILRHYWVYRDSTSHGCISYTLKIGSDTVLVLNNHFASNAISEDDKTMYKNLMEEPQEMNVKGNVHYLSRKVGRVGAKRAVQADSVAAFIQRHSDCPIILCGDFNDSPISYVHYRLTQVLNDAYVASGFGPGISYHDAGMYFRLDNIFCSDHWKAYSAAVDSHIDGSDHYPISCYLKRKE